MNIMRRGRSKPTWRGDGEGGEIEWSGGDWGREWGSGGEEVRLDEHQAEVTVEAHLEGEGGNSGGGTSGNSGWKCR